MSVFLDSIDAPVMQDVQIQRGVIHVLVMKIIMVMESTVSVSTS